MTEVSFKIVPPEGGPALTEDQVVMACTAMMLRNAMTMLRVGGVDPDVPGPVALAFFQIETAADQLQIQSGAVTLIERRDGEGECPHQDPPGDPTPDGEA